MKNLSKKNLRVLLLVAISITLVTCLGSTYAFFVYRGNGSNVSVEAGDINVKFNNDNNYLTTGSSYPISDETGKVLPYYSDFSINATTNDMGIKYEIQVVPDANNSIDPQYIKLYLTDQNDDSITNVLTYSELTKAEYNTNAKLVYTNYITETGTKDFRLRMWIDESYNLQEGQTFGFKIYLYAINEKVNFLSDKIEKTLTLTDASTDIDGTRYVTGNNDIPNYVWYSGKLWRIVSINGDDTIKLVTQGNMTSIAWDINDSTNYSTSQVRKWLNNEFLPTLANADTLLANSTWDYTTYGTASSTKAEPTAYVENEKVGLLTIYDFYKVGTGLSSFLNNNYIWWTMSPRTDGLNVWLVSSTGSSSSNNTPTSSYGVRPSVNLKSDIQIMGGAGTKSNPYVIGGDKDTGVTSELLSNRISGEYINFNDVLYRIVGTEEFKGQTLTKITMADYSLNKNTLTTSLAFGADESQRIFSPTYGIGLYLEEWYQADSTSETYSTIYIKDNYKAMIATSGENGDNVVWYTGPTSPTAPSRYDYTMAKTGTPVSATIGLGYYGEMFSNQLGDGYNSSTYIWLMTIYSSNSVWYVYGNGLASNSSPTDSYGVRASMYLKSDVKIVSGLGMPHDPYILTQ